MLEGSKGQQEGSEGQLVGSEGQPEGSEGHLSGFEGQPGGNGWKAKLTYGHTEVLPILQDFVPCQGRCPKSNLTGPKRSQGVSRGPKVPQRVPRDSEGIQCVPDITHYESIDKNLL